MTSGPLARLAGSSTINRILAATAGSGAILGYHGVVAEGTPAASMHLTATTLAHHFQAIAGLGFRFVPLTEMLDRMRRGRSVARCVAVTFDDAYAGLERAWPVLLAAGVPATVFVPTRCVDDGKPFWWDRMDAIVRTRSPAAVSAWAAGIVGRRPPAGQEAELVRAAVLSTDAGRLTGPIARAFDALDGEARLPADLQPASWDAIVRWSTIPGITVAPHTLTHATLPMLSPAEQRREMADSYAVLREHVADALPIIAYPYGLYDAATVAEARAAGMIAGVTMDRMGSAGDRGPFRIARLPFGEATRVDRIGLFVSAPWRWYRRRESRGGYPPVPGTEA